MKIIWESAVQVSTASRGNEKFWVIRVVTDGAAHYITTESWQALRGGGESTHINSVPRRVTGKNIGKTNETSDREQAISEAQSELRKKQDTGYYDLGGERPKDAFLLPMLAHKWADRKHNVKFPCYVQPKLDGTRMLHDGTRGWSRKGKLYKPEISGRFNTELPDDIVCLDGELMLPLGVGTFQEGVSAAKKVGPLTSHLVYYVYDYIPKDTSLTFKERHLRLLEWAKTHAKAFMRGEKDTPVQLVLTDLVNNEEGLKGAHKFFTQCGYEGTMIRNAGGVYKTDHRSVDLLKYKDFEDDEFEIIGANEGSGKDEGTVIWQCKTKEGKEFDVRPEGTWEQRADWWKRRKEFVGKMLTVRFQNYSDEGKPRFPVGVSVRDYE